MSLQYFQCLKNVDMNNYQSSRHRNRTAWMNNYISTNMLHLYSSRTTLCETFSCKLQLLKLHLWINTHVLSKNKGKLIEFVINGKITGKYWQSFPLFLWYLLRVNQGSDISYMIWYQPSITFYSSEIVSLVIFWRLKIEISANK